MLTGFVRQSDGTIDTLDTTEAVTAASARKGVELWIDLEEPTDDEVHAVGAAFRLDAEALEDCLSGEQRPRIDEFEDYIFLVLYGALRPDGNSEFDPRKLAAFLGPNAVITVHRQPIRSLSNVRDRCRRNARNLLDRGADFVLYSIIDAIVDNYILAADEYEQRLEDLEDDSLRLDVDESILARSGELRRELLELRRLATSQRELLTPVAKGEYEHVSEVLEQRFAHVEDHLMHATELIDALRDRLNAVHDNYHNALAHRTNAIMKTLTLFATIMLPLTLVAGIYGMNLPLWPPPDHPASFWGVLGGMLAITGTVLYYFRRKYWL
ncbi:MAG TPA: magnesium transporter CorA family protein [Phycisphaerae bacterium]|nr:magnesium transporter CorA family protein [Phycisphaerae bacterium]